VAQHDQLGPGLPDAEGKQFGFDQAVAPIPREKLSLASVSAP
jgi:hypothetical protein